MRRHFKKIATGLLLLASLSAWATQDTLPPIKKLVLPSSNTLEEEVPPKSSKLKHWLLTTKEKQARVNTFFYDEKKKPWKALAFSLVIPGAGQSYNDRHWKVPIVYAGIGVSLYAVAFNTGQYRRFKTAYIERVDSDPSTVDEFVGILSNSAILVIRDSYRTDLERSYIALTVVYLLNGVDAFVDAHLDSFNVSEDLSIKLRPTAIQDDYSIGGANYGIGLVIEF